MTILSTELIKPAYNKFSQFRDTANKIFLINPDKQLLRTVFTKIVSGLPSYPILTINSKNLQSKILQSDKIANENEQDIIDAIYPNPANDNCNIVFEENGKYDIALLNLHGDTIIHQILITEQIRLNLDKLPQGIYTLKIYSRETQETETSKITIEKPSQK